MLKKAIRELVFTRDTTRLLYLLNLADKVRKEKATNILCALIPLTPTNEGRLKWIKDKAKIKSLQLPDPTLLSERQKEGLCTRLEQSLRPLGMTFTASDNLSIKLKRLRSEVALTLSSGNEAKLAENFLNFCQENSFLMRPQKETAEQSKSISGEPKFWLDASERSVSVRTISGGLPDSNRRKH